MKNYRAELFSDGTHIISKLNVVKIQMAQKLKLGKMQAAWLYKKQVALIMLIIALQFDVSTSFNM